MYHLLQHPEILVLFQPGQRAAEMQLEPVRRHVRSHRLRWLAAPMSIEEIDHLRPLLSSGTPVQSVWYQLHWRQAPAETAQIVQRLREIIDESGTAKTRPTLVALDSFDDTTTGRFEVLDDVDLYVKKQVPADPKAWPAVLKGGMIASDYTVRTLGGCAPEVVSGHHRLAEDRRKVFVGPNLAAADFVRRLLAGRRVDQRMLSALLGRPAGVPPWQERSIDLVCRLNLGACGPQDWYHVHRNACLAALQPIRDRYNMVAGASGVGGTPSVSRQQFLAEMLNARVCISPFGYGELCYRDYEAMACGCLLVKPDVSHVKTSPDLLVAGETYVPVKWDFSDLAEVVERCLADPERSARIAGKARARLVAYHAEGVRTDVERLVEATCGAPMPAVDGLPEPVSVGARVA